MHLHATTSSSTHTTCKGSHTLSVANAVAATIRRHVCIKQVLLQPVREADTRIQQRRPCIEIRISFQAARLGSSTEIMVVDVTNTQRHLKETSKDSISGSSGSSKLTVV
jgi:hypothetical protein